MSPSHNAYEHERYANEEMSRVVSDSNKSAFLP
jgi:hypothetical protein